MTECLDLACHENVQILKTCYYKGCPENKSLDSPIRQAPINEMFYLRDYIMLCKNKF